MTTEKDQTSQNLLIQIDDLVRPAMPEEIQAIEARLAHLTTLNERVVENAAAKAALLDRLGITADEAALLLA